MPRMKPTGKTFFVSERHKAWHRSTVNLLLHSCSKAAALPFLSHPHMLRHACGFALADQGADTRLIQDCLGNRGATLPFMSDLGKVAQSNQSDALPCPVCPASESGESRCLVPSSYLY